MDKTAINETQPISNDNCGSVQSQDVPTAGCLFSGMGGLASGLVRAGFTIRWASDCDRFACETFRHRLPNVSVVEKDVKELSVTKDSLTNVDVVAAGFPCQSFSMAGNRKGFKDSRGRLFFEIPRLLAEFESNERPRLVVLENVPHLLHGADKSWFDEIRRALRRAGYWFREESCWTVNVKDATGLPQDRERLFMVAASRQHFRYNPFKPPIVPSDKAIKPGHINDFIDRNQPADAQAYLPEENRYYKMINAAMIAGESDKNIYQLRRSYVREKKHGLCPTLTANMGIGGHNVPFVRDTWGIRRLSIEEVAALQGFDADEILFPEIPTQKQYRLLGNAVCVQLAHLVAYECAAILKGEYLK